MELFVFLDDMIFFLENSKDSEELIFMCVYIS